MERGDVLGLHSSSPDDDATFAVLLADLPPKPLAFLRDHVSLGRPASHLRRGHPPLACGLTRARHLPRPHSR
ncbi:hypothetical protein PR202_ga11478 [Eleusine coracana subsp. coracana]|uniref:Uncharacterized protein n=1 Tax=Eleusine coracana subsp. coracana TaxID=191504 RepID=A0AAV5C933_ELECO|nr:hypothetical protein PR202_ga11478 [Eleusine coracana subsp. coracana]